MMTLGLRKSRFEDVLGYPTRLVPIPTSRSHASTNLSVAQAVMECQGKNQLLIFVYVGHTFHCCEYVMVDDDCIWVPSKLNRSSC